MTMFENIYISIMNDNIGSIADWFDSNNEEEKRIIEERSNDNNYTVLSLEESVCYMKAHPEKSYCLYGANNNIVEYLRNKGFDV